LEETILKNTLTITKKESRHLQLNEITMSKQELFHVIKDTLLTFYIDRLTDLDSYSNSEKGRLLNLIQNIINGKCNEIIKDKIPNEVSPLFSYNAEVIIKDDLEGCGNLEITINLLPSWIEAMGDGIEKRI
jgi:hypothetical protein